MAQLRCCRLRIGQLCIESDARLRRIPSSTSATLMTGATLPVSPARYHPTLGADGRAKVECGCLIASTGKAEWRGSLNDDIDSRLIAGNSLRQNGGGK